MYAIIETGGKQYPVKQGDVIDVELLDVEEGKAIEFTNVLFINNGKEIKIGAPYIAKSAVKGELVGDAKGDKIISFKYKSGKESDGKSATGNTITE